MKQLKDLFNNGSDTIITSLVNDSNNVIKGSLFFCIKGASFDAHSIVAEVIAKGAKAIIHTNELDHYEAGIFYQKVSDINEAMHEIALKYYDDPLSKLSFIGTTGTNGKSSISYIIYDLLNKFSKGAYIGTLGVEFDQEVLDCPLTTPDVLFLYNAFNEMVKHQVKEVAMEVSSHGLEQGRTKYLNFKYGIMSNISRDHLDYHKTMEKYLAAKSILFKQLKQASYAILNIDDESYDLFKKETKANIFTYGINNDADLMAKDIILNAQDTSFTLVYQDKEYLIKTNLIAIFNVYNLLAALSPFIIEGYDIEKIIPYLSNLATIKGRMEILEYKQPFNVIIDYAHTPDGFNHVLAYAQKIRKNNGLIKVLFGSAGSRDIGKRAILGEIASNYADEIILTSEDQRFEDPQEIANHIKEGIKDTPTIYIEDRSDAIKHVINNAHKDDVLLFLAKGTEDFMAINGEDVDYIGDKEVAIKALKKLCI